MAETKTINLNVNTNIDEINVKLNNIEAQLKNFTAAEINELDVTKRLIAEKKALQAQLDALTRQTKTNADTIRTASSNFSGLGNSVNQISRELPAFTMNLNTGFMAISNNLPILFDEINKVKQANIELAATGQPTQSVFKALTSAIFSWGTALSIGVTLLTVYGGKIIEYFTKDNEQRKENNNLISEGSKFIAKESIEYIGLINALKNTNQGSKERSDLIKKINNDYSTTLKNISDETLFQDQLNNSIKDYLIYQRAKFELKKNEEKITNLLQRQSEVQNKLAGAEINLQQIQSQGVGSGRFTGGYENYNETLKNAEKQVQRYTYSNNELNKQLELLGYTQLQLIEQTEGKYIPVKEKEKNKIEEIRDLNNEIRQEEIKLLNDKHLEEYAQLEFDANKRIKEIEDSNATEKQKAELIKLIKRNLLSDQLELEQSYKDELAKQDKEAKDKQLKEDEKFAEEKSKLAQKILDEQAKNIQKEIKDENELRQKSLQMTVASLSILSDAMSLYHAKNEKDARNAFKIQKALNLATAITNTALAVTSALTAGGNPIKLATGMQFVEAGIAAAAGAVQIAKISQTQFGQGTSNNSPNQTTSAPTGTTAPNLAFNYQGVNPYQQLLNGLTNNPIKAYVVSSDVTTAQMLDAKAIATSTL